MYNKQKSENASTNGSVVNQMSLTTKLVSDFSLHILMVL